MQDVVTSRPSATARVYGHVKAAIIDGSYPGMTLLNEAATALELGVSRTPVREAFLRLQTEGWLRLYPKRGAIVVAAREGEWREVAQARLLIEAHAAETVIAWPERRVELAQELVQIATRQRAALDAGDDESFAEADSNFDTAILDAAGNLVLSDFLVSLRERQERLLDRALMSRPEVCAAIVADHLELAEAIRVGDLPAFRATLQRHLAAGYRHPLGGPG